jgi:uncharacterized membrane protein
MLIIGVALYPYLPDILATHWGINGNVNGYSSKLFALFFMPILSIVLFAIFLLLPKLEPYKKNFAEFDQYYFLFINIIFAFFFYLYSLTIFWYLGTRFNMVQAMAPAFAVLYYYAGVLMKNTHRNWFVGIRTPWTMQNETVWKRTHSLGSKLFECSGILALIAVIVPQFSLFLLLLPVISTSIILYFYSYFISQSHHHL